MSVILIDACFSLSKREKYIRWIMNILYCHIFLMDCFICRVLVALMFGALITGQNIALAPNYSEAKVSARKIFAVLNQTPNINARSKEGLAPVSGRLETKWLDKISVCPNLTILC